MKVGLYFGSYNPIHIGHLIIANSMLEHSDMDEVWFVVSPQNPFKVNQSLLDDKMRLEMVSRAVDGNDKLKACSIELSLPKPSFTYVTLMELRKRYADIEFCIIMGSDNLERFEMWRNYQEILDRHHLYVYPRPNHLDIPLATLPQVTIMPNLPMLEISSTYIRDEIQKGRSVQYLVSDKVWDYIKQNQLYK